MTDTDTNNSEITENNLDEETQEDELTLPVAFPGNVEVFWSDDIPERPLITKKRNVIINSDKIKLEGKSLSWNELISMEIKYFLGNPYFQLNFGERVILNLWFPTGWRKWRYAPWYGSSKDLSEKFLKVMQKIKPELANTIILPNENDVNPLLENWTTTGKLFQYFMNFLLLAIPGIPLLLIIAFFAWAILFAPEARTEF